VFYGSNLSRKDNPRWVSSNATETPKVPQGAFRLLPVVTGPRDHLVADLSGGLAVEVSDWVRRACGICASWVIGLPRRAGARLHAPSDDEARWWRWQVTERQSGLVHQYRDPRFALREPGPVSPGCPYPGGR
jgi:hypothetical protein